VARFQPSFIFFTDLSWVGGGITSFAALMLISGTEHHGLLLNWLTNKHVLLRSPEWSCLFFLRLYGKTRPNFGPIFSIITSKYAQKHYVKKKIITCKNFYVKKTAKMVKNCCFFHLEGQILTLFSRFFANDF